MLTNLATAKSLLKSLDFKNLDRDGKKLVLTLDRLTTIDRDKDFSIKSRHQCPDPKVSIDLTAECLREFYLSFQIEVKHFIEQQRRVGR
jgi:hypothetical protein